jgi:hypothetical protein
VDAYKSFEKLPAKMSNEPEVSRLAPRLGKQIAGWLAFIASCVAKQYSRTMDNR